MSEVTTQVHKKGLVSVRLYKETVRCLLMNIDKYDNQVVKDDSIQYHLDTMTQGRLIEGVSHRLEDGMWYIGLDLLPEGESILSKVYDEDVWQETIKEIEAKGLTLETVNMDVVVAVANRIVEGYRQ